MVTQLLLIYLAHFSRSTKAATLLAGKINVGTGLSRSEVINEAGTQMLGDVRWLGLALRNDRAAEKRRQQLMNSFWVEE